MQFSLGPVLSVGTKGCRLADAYQFVFPHFLLQEEENVVIHTLALKAS
jgi:hypothetical protein